jgi:hypothetical protein
LERFGVKIIRLSRMRHVIKRDDFDRLLEKAAAGVPVHRAERPSLAPETAPNVRENA